jgi:hypothetical protein
MPHPTVASAAIGAENCGRCRGGGVWLCRFILTRQLSESLSVPLFLVDPKVIYCATTSRRSRSRAGASKTPGRWSSAFTSVDGQPSPPEDLPLMVALAKR